MSKEFNLSEEMEEVYKQYVDENRTVGELFSWLIDINKEFIKKLKDGAEINSVERGQFNASYFESWIDLIAGDKLC